MAYQQQGGMSNGVQGGPGDHHGPQGTEYTLQGVMRFLQIEWHNHERARNAWDIERAEMKAKIAKQEGECRFAKRSNEQLERQLRLLETALKAERAKKGTSNGSDGKMTEAEAQKELKSKRSRLGPDGGMREQRPEPRPHNSFLETDEPPGTSEKERDQYLDNTTKYLKNCMKEIQYLLTPPQNPPPPPHMLPNGNYTGLPDPPLSIEDIYARHQRRNGSQQGQQLPESAAMPNHQPPPIPDNMQQHPDTPQEQLPGSREVRYLATNHGQQRLEPLQPQEQSIPAPYEEPAENVTHTYDSYGRAIPIDQQEQQQNPPQPRQSSDTDGWNFDEEPNAPPENAPPDVPPTRRPDTDLFPSAANNTHMSAKSPPRSGPGSHRRKSSGSQPMSRRRSSQGKTDADRADLAANSSAHDPSQFRVKFALRGHLDVVRAVIFSGGGSPSEPEVCTAGDDGMIKRWIVPYQNYGPANTQSMANNDLDIQSYFTHRGHDGVVTSLACCPPSTGFSTGGRASGDGWIFSGGQDATVRVWERGRVDPKATLEGHTDAVWAVCVLPATIGAVFGQQASSSFGGPERLLLVSGSADGTVKIWAITPPPQSQQGGATGGSRRGVGGSRRHSVTSGSNFPSSPQPSVASSHPFSHTLVHSIARQNLPEGSNKPSPTSISPLSPTGETFVVSYTDSAVLVFDTRTGEEVIGMASNETYDGTLGTSINSVVATSLGLEGSGTSGVDLARGLEGEEVGAGATGSREAGVEGVVISGHEDRFVRFFDANSGQCTYTMLAHPSAISALALSKDGREAVSAGHDSSIRFWSLEKRICTQEIISHRVLRGEGVCDVCWSQDGRLVVSVGGDGGGKVFVR